MKHKKTFRSEVAQWIADRVLVTEAGCWLMLTGASGHNGYRCVTVAGRHYRAHRATYAALVGRLPKDALVCHKCDVRACVNPEHLFLGTPADNTRDMRAKGRARGGRLCGDDNPRSKVSSRDVAAIRRERAAGTKCSELARRYGLHRTTITRITHFEAWKSSQDAESEDVSK